MRPYPRVAHQRERGPHHVEGAAQMDIDDGVEVLVAHLFQRPAPHGAGVVDEDVDPPVVVQRRSG